MPTVGVGGRATSVPVVASRAEPPSTNDNWSGGRRLSADAVAWGLDQAAKAPAWSTEKRRRVAALLGLVLAD
ncbi:hypothetical protein [Frankia sp. AgB32]|uniref:hypothetical protein n=1 Tax=Frankia sp. AgB32 TaxID=631119 RepID=UPI00200DBE64|nr:hypothetical protein [Frankia sp. AgB32]MCK9893363.1 hypothetical protein [Frankia sp. AgB32]